MRTVKPSRPRLNDPVHFFALGFGAGLSPIAPGTFGTLMAIPFVWFGLTYLSITAYIAMTLLIFLAGIYICGKTATDTGTEDHSAIVWDEIAGYFVAMVAVAPSWTHLFIAFVLFRLFDITKPWPISWCDKHIKGGVGIMLDDILAGLLTWICMQVLVINAIF